MKTIVISGINIYEGGPLSVYKDCLDNIINSNLNKSHNVIAFVHKKEIFSEYEDKVKLIELPKSRRNYLYRLWYEYIYFYFYSKGKTIDVWFSLHDITPNVHASKRYVYCHNPSPFMKTEIKNLKYSYKNFLFSIFYKYLYKINIKKNKAVIVQQDWMRTEFKKMFDVENVIVARPSIKCMNVTKNSNVRNEKFQFIYAAYPRFFKNFEVICEASSILKTQGVNEFEVLLTIDGYENKYARDLLKKYSKFSNIKFIGVQDRNKIFELYGEVNCLIFPSKLETWGLPISEFKATGKAIIAANLPYAKETVGTYNKVVFFNPDNAIELADLMMKEIKQTNLYTNINEKEVKEPYANSWKRLTDMIF